MVAERDHPRHPAGERLDLRQERIPLAGVVVARVPGQPVPGLLRVADVARVQMERRTLRLDKGVEADRGVTRVLVTEGGEGERPGAVRAGSGGEGVDRVRGARVGGVEAVVADAVVVRRVGAQVVQCRVHVVLVDVGALADPGGSEQVAYLRRDAVAQVEGASADPEERCADGQRHLPRHPHLGLRIGAVGEMPAERRDQRTVHGGRGGSRHRRGRRRRRDTAAAREGDTGGGDRATAQQTATGEGAAEVLVLLGHAQGVGEPVGKAHTRSVHGRDAGSGG